jgi:hypothetical protein
MKASAKISREHKCITLALSRKESPFAVQTQTSISYFIIHLDINANHYQATSKNKEHGSSGLNG